VETRALTYVQVTADCSSALMKAAYVYVWHGGVVPPLASLYVGPYKVVARQPKFFRLEVGGRLEVVSLDHLKPHLGQAAVEPAQPPL